MPLWESLAVYPARSRWCRHRACRRAVYPGANTSPARQADPDNAEQVALGQQVYASFCAGCHGGNLEGQPNWQKRLPLGNFPAPPHDETGHTWHHADQWLFEIVKYGGKYHAPHAIAAPCRPIKRCSPTPRSGPCWPLSKAAGLPPSGRSRSSRMLVIAKGSPWSSGGAAAGVEPSDGMRTPHRHIPFLPTLIQCGDQGRRAGAVCHDAVELDVTLVPEQHWSVPEGNSSRSRV